MRRRNKTLYPVLATAGRRMEKLALTRIADPRRAPVMRQGGRMPFPHATHGGVIARPRHEAALVRDGRTQCARSRPCVRTPGYSAVAINTLAVAP